MEAQLELADQDILDLVVQQVESVVALNVTGYFLENFAEC